MCCDCPYATQIQARNHLAIREVDSGASDQLGELNEDVN